MATAISSPLGTVYRVTREELDQLLAEVEDRIRKESGK